VRISRDMALLEGNSG